MRKLLFLIGVLVFALPVFAQDATPEATTAPESAPWTCPDGFQGQTLSVFNWSTYVAEDTISNFEKACGVTVTYDVYESNEALLARLRGGNPGYDIIVPTDYMISIMISEGLLEPIDVSAIPNFANVSPTLAEPAVRSGQPVQRPLSVGHHRHRLQQDQGRRRDHQLGPSLQLRWSGRVARRPARHDGHRPQHPRL